MRGMNLRSFHSVILGVRGMAKRHLRVMGAFSTDAARCCLAASGWCCARFMMLSSLGATTTPQCHRDFVILRNSAVGLNTRRSRP